MITNLFRKLSGRPEEAKQAAPSDAKAERKTSSEKTSTQSSATSKKRADKARKPRKKARPEKPWTLDQFPVAPVEGKTRFHDLDLPLPVMHAIADLGFEYCSPIQGQSLPHTLNGHDLVGKAQTGTGKTAAFLVSVIDDLLKHQDLQPI